MRVLVERQRDALSRDMSWLDRLIDEERGAGGAPGLGQVPQPAAGPLRLVPLASASQLQRAVRRGPGVDAPTG